MMFAGEEIVDGRHARRERGRLAVIDAMVDLVLEGHAPPQPELVAERAGVSLASLYRYFKTLDDLQHHTTMRYFERFADLFEVPDVGEGAPDRRIDRFVAARVELHEHVAPMARLARSRVLVNPALADTLYRVRSTMVDQVRHQFETELDALSPASRDDVVGLIATTTSFESWDQLRHDHRRSPLQIRRAWKRSLAAMLSI